MINNDVWWWLYWVGICSFPRIAQTTVLDLHGATLNVSVNLVLPFCNFRTINNKLEKQYSIEFELLELLESKFNFKTNLVHENQIWGDLVDGNYWNGVVGGVVNQTSQMGMCCLSVSHKRHKVVQFSSIVTYDHATFMGKGPKLASREWIIFSPFKLDVWLFIFISFIILTFIIHLPSRFIPPNHSISCQSILLHLAKIFLKQNIDRIHRPSRLFYLLWFLATLVLSNSYCGRFYSILALPEMEPPLDTIADLLHLANQDKILISAGKSSSYVSAFFAARPETDQVYYQIAQSFKRNNPKLSIKVHDLINIVEQSVVPTVFVNSRSSLVFSKNFFAHQPLHVASDNFENDFYAVAFAKQSSFYHPFNRIIKQSFEFGFTEHWTRNVYHQTPGALKNELAKINISQRIGALRLFDVYSILIFWIIGNVLAFFIFLLELGLVVLN